jgi:hypothetical protein
MTQDDVEEEEEGVDELTHDENAVRDSNVSEADEDVYELAQIKARERRERKQAVRVSKRLLSDYYAQSWSGTSSAMAAYLLASQLAKANNDNLWSVSGKGAR